MAKRKRRTRKKVTRKKPVRKPSTRDSTSAIITDRSLIDYVPAHDTGYPMNMSAQDTPENLAMLGPAVRDFPDSLWIEPKDYKDVARDNDKYKLWGEDVKNRFTNQHATHECTSHALIQVGEVAWNQQRKGKGDPVLFSQISVYAEANPRQWGEAGYPNRSRARTRSSSTRFTELPARATTTTPAVRGFPCRSFLTGGKRQR